MARNNNKPLVIGAAVLGVLALLTTIFVLFGGGSAPAQKEPNMAVETPKVVQYQAIRDIPPRTQLTSSMFRQVDVDSANAVPGALASLNALNGRLSNNTITKDQVVTTSDTTERVRRIVPANIPIPPNSRAIAIWVNPNQTAAGLVDSGDHVDVIATHRFSLSAAPNTRIEGASQITTGRVIAQNLLVLAVDRSIDAPPPTPTPVPGAPPQAPGAAPAPTPAPNPNVEPRTRVLLAAPIDVAARLVAAQQDGTLHVAIRNPSSNEQFPIPEAREYPSRLVSVPNPAAAVAANAARQARAERNSVPVSDYRPSRRDLMGDSSPSIPAPNVNQSVNVPPAIVPNGQVAPSNVPPADTNNEVTVIRGTEKTRVLVPR